MTNIQHLRNILEGYEIENTEEALEFLDAIEQDEAASKREIDNLERQAEWKKDEDQVFDNSDFVGLDTINWSLQNGNLKVQGQMENVIKSLQKQNCVAASYV